MADTLLPKTYHLIHGWAEGKWHSKQLKADLRTAGFAKMSKEKAAVVRAHSAGSFFVPQATERQVCVIVGFPVWPKKSLVRAALQKVWLGARTSRPGPWLVKSCWNLFYLVTRPLLMVKQWQALHQPLPFNTIPASAILVRNHDDTYCTPQLAQLVKNQVVDLPGQHDDLWVNTPPYVKIIEEAYARLLA